MIYVLIVLAILGFIVIPILVGMCIEEGSFNTDNESR